VKIDGACLCGEISYEAEIDPAKVIICHCIDCQRNSASAFRWGTMVTREQFKLLKGKPKIFIKTAESGNKRTLAFCGTCGTSLYGAAAENAEVYSLRLGTATQARELRPSLQIWRRSALDWVDGLSTISAVSKQPNFSPSPGPDGEAD
jgi:hypothetical protein